MKRHLKTVSDKIELAIPKPPETSTQETSTQRPVVAESVGLGAHTDNIRNSPEDRQQAYEDWATISEEKSSETDVLILGTSLIKHLDKDKIFTKRKTELVKNVFTVPGEKSRR